MPDEARIVTPIHYATYFDRHYLPRGVALYRSLVRHSPPFVLWVLCLDTEVEQTLTRLGLQHVIAIPVAELERADQALLAVKPERQPLEYYWTCGPAFLWFVFQRDPQIGMLTYLDADLLFFGNPAPVYEALGDRSILLLEQRFSPSDPIKPKGGRYNVGLLVFRRTAGGLACLRRWREQCLEWCFDRFEPDRHGDQKYLDDWPEQYDATVLRYAGVGVAPWNVGHQRVEFQGRQVLIDGDPLVCYHFARLRRINRWLYEMHDNRFHRAKAAPIVRRRIYAPYVRELRLAERHIRKVGGRVHQGTIRTATPGEVTRRSQAAGVPRTSLGQYQRFMLAIGSVVL